ncbi:hypothetical protein EKN56_03450 [Limnobaculum zhutongyuii]|uniref:Uncharacterized protein n=2 Tax=Limnobaculum zhutongyuii TaxID=2498113 RepID=A0A411WGW6_9GAMM|nr:hypothetical protein EKN56_03450 [Limnobaculum zhutongyuii]TQS88769.1 hypothetical protein ELQ32_09145 [Limnobaculum zhutongyuii]
MMEESLELVFMPPLIVLLINAQNNKGEPLTQSEVEAIRDKAVCIALPAGSNAMMAEKRGYDDIDPEFVWQEYLHYLSTFSDTEDNEK